MISGFDPDKVGTQTVTVTYTDENGEVYTATFTVKVTRPVETLGEKDEVTQENDITDTLIPATVGLGITGLLLLLVTALTKKNVEIYAITEEERKLIDRKKISKNNKTISLEGYEEYNNLEIVINSKMASKIDGENVEVITKAGTTSYKVNAKENEDFVIKM